MAAINARLRFTCRYYRAIQIQGIAISNNNKAAAKRLRFKCAGMGIGFCVEWWISKVMSDSETSAESGYLSLPLLPVQMGEPNGWGGEQDQGYGDGHEAA